MTVVVLGSQEGQLYGAWGKGDTRTEAIANAVANRMVKSNGFSVLTFPPGCTDVTVNDMGDVQWRGHGDPEVEEGVTE